MLKSSYLRQRSLRPGSVTLNAGQKKIITCVEITQNWEMHAFAKETKSKKLLFQELPYHGVNIIFYNQGQVLKVAPKSKLAVRSLSTSMARALKPAQRPRKN